MELMTMRSAAVSIGKHVGISRGATEKVIKTGFAGRQSQAGGQRLVAASEVARLASLPSVDDADLDAITDHCGPLLVLRPTMRQPWPLPDRAWMGIDANALGTRAQDLAVFRWYSMSPDTVAAIRRRLDHGDPVPVVVSVGGLIVLCRNVVDLVIGNATEPAAVGFEVAPAAWSDHLENRWMKTPGGGPWLWWPQSPPGSRRRGRHTHDSEIDPA